MTSDKLKRPIRYNWDIDPSDLDLVTTAQILDAYEDGQIGARLAMRLLAVDTRADLHRIMDQNGRTLPFLRPMVLTDELMTVVAAACGREWTPARKRATGKTKPAAAAASPAADATPPRPRRPKAEAAE